MAIPDSVILELLARIQKCENNINDLILKVDSLENSQVISGSSDDSVDEADDEKVVTRGPARKLIMKKIHELKPDAVIRPANRNEGSGIFISDAKGNRKFKFYHSRTYALSSEKVISWSGVQQKDVKDKYDGYIFSIWYDEKLYTLLFTHQQLVDLISATNKLCDPNNKYHFSFTIKPNLQVFETRGSTTVDVTYSLNNYKIFD